jgi:glycosyltransferase involved in cell wall biosynthesis
MPVYNAASFMSRALTSAQRQTVENIEILVIDDKSTDATLEVAYNISKSDSRVRVLSQSRNGGPSQARNRGIEEARGEWIALLDDDDNFHPDRLCILIAEPAPQKADVIFDNIELYDPHSQMVIGIGVPPSLLSSGVLSISDFLKGCDPFLAGTKLANLKAVIRKSVLKDHHISYSDAYIYGEDLKFYLDIFLTKSAVYYVERALYTYTVQTGGLGQKSPFSRTVHDTSQLIGAMTDTLSRWQGNIAPETQALLRQRLDALREFQSFIALKNQIKERRPLEFVRSVIQNPRAFARLANHALSGLNGQQTSSLLA